MQDKHSYTSLYEGLFQEVFATLPTEQYGHIVYHTNTRQLSSIDTTAQAHELIDPVAFAYDFGARMYDARIGRWMSTDPLKKLYPYVSPYTFAINSPILILDVDGRKIRNSGSGDFNNFSILINSIFNGNVTVLQVYDDNLYMKLSFKIENNATLTAKQQTLFNLLNDMSINEILYSIKIEDKYIGGDIFNFDSFNEHSLYTQHMNDIPNGEEGYTKLLMMYHFFYEQKYNYDLKPIEKAEFNPNASDLYDLCHLKTIMSQTDNLGFGYHNLIGNNEGNIYDLDIYTTKNVTDNQGNTSTTYHYYNTQRLVINSDGSNKVYTYMRDNLKEGDIINPTYLNYLQYNEAPNAVQRHFENNPDKP